MAVKHQIRWLQTALRNLDQEAIYIARDNPKAALDFVSQIINQIERLALHPESGRPGRVPGTRELIITKFSHIIPYRIRFGYVEILRIFHTSRQYPPKS